MSTATALGLTWDHPRGHLPLEAAAERSRVGLEWRRQSLEGFESHGLQELAERYELLVIDHPHVGDAATSGVLQALGSDVLDGLPPAMGASASSHVAGGGPGSRSGRATPTWAAASSGSAHCAPP